MHSSWSEWVIVMPWVLVPHTQAYRFKSVSQRQHPKPTFWEAGIGSWDPTHCALTSSQHCSYSLLLFLDEWRVTLNTLGPPCGSDGKESAWKAGDAGLIPGLGRPPEKGNGNPLQYSCLENPMDRGAWRDTIHRVPKSQAQKSDFRFLFM